MSHPEKRSARRARWFVQNLLSALFFAVAPFAAWAADAHMYLGSVAMDVPAEMVKRLSPLATYLSTHTNIPVSFRAAANLGSAVDDLGAGRTQIAYLTPVAYIDAREKYRAIPLVSPLTRGKPTFTLVIAVRRDSSLARMADLKGKHFAFGDEKALLQRAVVVQAGIQLTDFSAYAFLKHYDNIAKAVLNGDFDAGILKDTIAEQFAPQGLRIIHTSPPLPSYLFAVSEQVPHDVRKKLLEAFLQLDGHTPETRAILKNLDPGYDGFVPVEDADYDVVRKLIKPFQSPDILREGRRHQEAPEP